MPLSMTPEIPPAPPTTTLEEDRKTAGQAAIALMVVLATVISGFMPKTENSTILANAFFLVIGFYFGRTNHARKGERE
jgi:hypothetical protein